MMNELPASQWFGSKRSELPSASQWFKSDRREELPASQWLIAQLAYDRIRRQYREDGLNSEQIEAQLQWAAVQLTGRTLRQLEADKDFALFLEQVVQGNAFPHY